MRLRSLTALALVALAAFAMPAHAGQREDFTQIFNDYRVDGEIDGCKYSAQQLKRVLDSIPPDVAQYAPGFEDALRAALEQRARGCGKGGGGGQGSAAVPGGPAPPPGGPAAPPGATIIKPPPGPNALGRKTVAGVASPSREVSRSIRALDPGAGAPAVVQVLGIAAVLAGLIGLALMVARYFGWSGERYFRPLRTAVAEASTRSSDFLADFRDWVRFGR